MARTQVITVSRINQLSDNALSVMPSKLTAKVTAKTLAVTLAVSARTIERELNFLRKEGYITKEGKSNNGVWKVLK